MSNRWNKKRTISLLLTGVMMIGMLPFRHLAAAKDPYSVTPAEKLEENVDGNTVYYEVSFALPNGLTKEEKDEIKLPETMMLPEGTLIYAVAEPTRENYGFAGWYYDAALTKPADGADSVDRNMTLYPSFAPLQNYDDTFRINYISTLDVEPDFAMEVVAYGLSEEQIKNRMKVTNLSKVEGEEEIVLERLAPDMSNLIPDTRVRTLAKDACMKAQTGNLSESLTDALKAIVTRDEKGDEVPALSDAVIAELVLYYAPVESEFSEAMKAADILNRVYEANLDPKKITASQLVGLMTDQELQQSGLSKDSRLEEIGDEVIDLEERFAEVLKELPAAHYSVRCPGGWNRGDMHQLEILDTTLLRFFRDGIECTKYVVYYNITVHQDDFNNMKLSSSVVFLPFDQVSGVSLDNGLFKADSDGDDMTVVPNDDKGVLTYKGDKSIEVGTKVAVYDGKLKSDGTVDGSVGYFKITEVKGNGEYAYETPDFEDVIFLPDIIPVQDDGSFKDGNIFVSADQLQFGNAPYKDMGLDSDTVVEPGDFIAVYKGNMSNADSVEMTGYGCITAVEEKDGGLQIRYDEVSEQTLRRSSDMFMQLDNVPVPMTEEELKEVGEAIKKDVEDSGFLEDSAEYIGELVSGNDEAVLPDSKYSDALKEIKFQRDGGGEISLEEVQKLAGGSKVEVEWPPKLSFLMGVGLQHFTGTGLRGELAAEMTIKIKLNDGADIKITVVAMIEVEVAFGLTIKWEVEWRKALVFPYIYDIGGTVGLHAGIYVGAGITVTVQTVDAEQEEPPVKDLMPKDENTAGKDKQGKAYLNVKKLASGIEKIAKMSKFGSDGLGITHVPGGETNRTITKKDDNENFGKDGEGTEEMHNSVGGSFEEKYSNFIQGSDAKYVTLVNKQLAKFDLPADPLHVIALSLGINFVVKFKLNVMLGVSITYGNAKQITANFTVFHPSSSSTCGDLETPNFQVDFFIFGMVGIRVGFEFDFRIGVISTTIASLGVTAEIGVYLEFYGYFYVGYKWESGKGSSTEMFGSLLAQFGLYLDIDFKVQMGEGKLEKRFDIYDVRWPLLSLGDEFCALDFEIEDEDEKLNLSIEARTEANKNEKSTDTKVIGGASIKVPDELFDIQFLEIDTGDIDSDNMDRNVAVGGSSSFTAWGVNYVQQDERNFHVEFTPKGKNFTDATAADKAKGAFLYDPVTNTIYAKPNSVKDTELWGEFTFTWYQGEPAKTKSLLNYGAGFGLNTRKIERTVKVHWTGTPVKGTADVYLCKERGMGLAPENNQVSFVNPKAWYTKKETIDFDGLDGVLYYMDVNSLASRYPGYRLAFAKETYDVLAWNAYLTRYTEGKSNILLEFVRGLLYGAETIKGDKNSRGWLMVFPGDEYLYFMMHAPDTKADLYFNFYDTETDWHILNEKADSNKPLASVYEKKIPASASAEKNIPDTLKQSMQNDAYDYEWYYYPAQDTTCLNSRVERTREVIKASQVPEKYKNEAISNNLINMPTFSEFIGDKNKWQKLDDTTLIPAKDTVFFAIRTPKTFTVTWKYDDYDKTTKVKYGEALKAPAVPTRSGYSFLYWQDKDGKQYSTMPARNLTLYPKFVGSEYTVIWILDGQTKTSKVKAGINPLNNCPFKINNQGINWTTTKGDLLTTINEEYEMPKKDVTLYGVYTYQCDWVLYDTGNGKYTPLRSDYRYQETLAGEKVLENLPEEVSKYLTDKRYTYDCYRVYTTGIDNVKAQKDKWGTVYNSTLFYAYNGTYILRRSPVMVNVTWKYDDGDIVTSNWVGRKLTPPKEISRKGYTLVGWADANGKTYEYPPYEDVTLYPQFVEHEHTWDEGTVTSVATCIHTGSILYTCTDCGKTKTEEIPIDPNNHVGETELRDAKEATCTEDGYTGDTYCTSCGAIISEGKVIPAFGHDYELTGWTWTGFTAATAAFTCKHDASHTEKVPATITSVRTEPTETEEGSVVYTATVTFEGETYTDTKTENLKIIKKPKLGSEFTAKDGGAAMEKTVLWNFASEEYGSQSKTYLSELDPAKDLQMWAYVGNDQKIDATLTWAEDYSSVRLDEIQADDVFTVRITPSDTEQYVELIATLTVVHEHDPMEPTIENYVDPTCDEPGSFDEVVYCATCHEELSRVKKTIPALGHDLISHKAKAATCKEAGNSAYWYCKRCDKYFSDEKCQHEIAKDSWVIPVDPTAHVPGEAVRKEPYPILNDDGHCTEGWHTGSYVVTCTVCGKELENKIIKVKPTLINEEDTLTFSIAEFLDDPDGTLADYESILSYWWPGVTSKGCMSDDRWDLEGAKVTWNKPNTRIGDIEPGDKLSVHIRPADKDLDTYAEVDIMLTVTEAPQPEPETFKVIWRDGSANGSTLKTAEFENGCAWSSLKAAMPAVAPREGQSYVWYFIMGNNGSAYPGSEDPSQVSPPQTEEELHYYDDTQLWIKGEIWDTVIIYTVWSPDEISVGPSSVENTQTSPADEPKKKATGRKVLDETVGETPL